MFSPTRKDHVNGAVTRSFRCGPVWDEAVDLAKARGETITAVLHRALRQYVRRARREQTGR